LEDTGVIIDTYTSDCIPITIPVTNDDLEDL